MKQEDLKNAWSYMIEHRAQTRTWNMSKTVTRETMQEIVNELHRRSPSKQNRVHYQMHVLDWTDTELRNKIFKIARDPADNPKSNYPCNSQTLAHWLCIFSKRNSADYKNYKLDNDRYIDAIEIGIASATLVYSAFARGLDSGFCRCFEEPEHPDWKEITSKLGIDDPGQIRLMVGIGIKSKDRSNTKNLHTDTNIYVGPNIPEWQFRPKPKQETYVKWIL